jgi:cell cycle serine/threonine-protein kinase CDC5/MSD2
LKFDLTNINQASFISRRIRDNEYEFPTERAISSAVQHLISQILTPVPSQRPTLHEIVDHAFFTLGPVPSYIPTSAHDTPPDFGRISKPISDNNLKRLRKYSLLDMDYSSLPSNALPSSGSSGVSGGLASSKSITTSIAQQEKEFQKAVQPGSPISALLSSARQPLLMGTGAGAAGMGVGGANTRESPLLRKLQAVKESPLGRRSVTRGLDGIVEEKENNHRRKGGDDGMEQHEEEEMRLRKKELEAQKARIVAQMAPVREEPEVEEAPVAVAPKPRERVRERYGAVDRENVAPPVPRVAVQPSKYGSLRDRAVMDKENTGNFLPFYGIPSSC